MARQIYRGRIRIKGNNNNHEVEVEVRATSPSQAKSIVFGLYDVKIFSQQMHSVR